MKKLLIIIGLTVSLSAIAQTNDQIKSSVISFTQNVESNRSLTIAVYPSYAPSILVNGKKDNYGMGIELLTPSSDILPAGLGNNTVVQHSFIGLRFDYLAHEAFASTVGLGLKGDFQLWGHNFELFTQGGANIPFSGFGIHNGDIGAMAGGGLYTVLWQPSKNVILGVQFSAEKWTQFQGEVFHGGPVFNWSF